MNKATRDALPIRFRAQSKFISAVALSALAGCVNAEAFNAKSVGDIRTRAAFDMHCDANALKFSPLAKDGYDIVRQYGVEGCGQASVYVSTPSGWVVNTHANEKK
jgi:hypothetical protein